MSIPTKVLLIDDHHLFNEGIKALFILLPEFNVCGQVYKTKDIEKAIQTLNPDLVLLDANIHGENGIEIGAKIVSNWNVKVIILTMYNQPKLIEEAQKVGLHGYLLKDSTKEELLKGINEVINGRVYFVKKVTILQESKTKFEDDFTRKLNLTFREIELIRLLKSGLTNEQIAEILHLSIFTVKTHRKNIHFKLGINNLAELIDFANKNGI